ncbi:MAG: hypothetical protein JWN30_1263, partial [Bacilli bacterium]|nr:hypothetical protein [Bacilli bacterium]
VICGGNKASAPSVMAWDVPEEESVEFAATVGLADAVESESDEAVFGAIWAVCWLTGGAEVVFGEVVFCDKEFAESVVFVELSEFVASAT